jgi:hypothetical protein
MEVQEHPQTLLQEQTLTCHRALAAMRQALGQLTLPGTLQLQQVQQPHQAQLLQLLLATVVLQVLTAVQAQLPYLQRLQPPKFLMQRLALLLALLGLTHFYRQLFIQLQTYQRLGVPEYQ